MSLLLLYPGAGEVRELAPSAITGASVVASSVVRDRRIIGAITGASGVTGSVVRARTLAVNITGASAVGGVVVRARPVTTAIVGGSAVTAAVARDRSLPSFVTGTSTVTAAVTPSTPSGGGIGGSGFSPDYDWVARALDKKRPSVEEDIGTLVALGLL